MVCAVGGEVKGQDEDGTGAKTTTTKIQRDQVRSDSDGIGKTKKQIQMK
jgi:hypothetical protein